MNHCINIVENRRIEVANVSWDHIHLVANHPEGVVAKIELVEHADVMPPVQEHGNEHASDVAAASRHENVHE